MTASYQRSAATQEIKEKIDGSSVRRLFSTPNHLSDRMVYSVEWINKRTGERKDKLRIQQAIGVGMNAIWHSLQAELERCCEAYTDSQQAEKAIRTVATLEEIEVVIQSFNPTYGQDRTIRSLKLKLDRKNREIKTSHLCVRFGVNEKQQVCLLDQTGAEISIEDLAQMVIDPLFFPDLQPVQQISGSKVSVL